jgi:hypothetical protein
VGREELHLHKIAISIQGALFQRCVENGADGPDGSSLRIAEQDCFAKAETIGMICRK